MKIGTKLTLIGIATCSFIISSFAYISYREMAKMQALSEEKELKAQHTIIADHMLSETKTAEKLAALIANMPPIQAAFAQQDRPMLSKWLIPTFKVMQQQYGVEQFQFHMTGTVENGNTSGTPSDAISFFRVHQPSKYGDDLSGFRKSVVTANQTQQAQHGFEKGVFGLAMRGVVPMFHENKPIGTVEFGMRFDKNFFNTFKTYHDIDAALYIAGVENIEVGQHHLDDIDLSQATFTTFARTFSIDDHQGDKRQPHLLTTEELRVVLQTKEGVIVHKVLNNQSVAVYSKAIQDFSNKNIGVLSIIADRSDYLAAKQYINHLILIMIALTFAGAFLFVFIVRGMIEKPICEMAIVMKHISNGNLNITMNLGKQDDEISIMRHAVHRMSTKMKTVIEDIQDTISAAKQGDLTKRVQTDELQGFMKTLGESTNALVDNTESVINDIKRITHTLAEGRLNVEQLKTNYEGIYADVSYSAQLAVTNLQKMMDEIQVVVEHAGRGELQEYIHLTDKKGFHKELSKAINQLIDIQQTFSHDMANFFERIQQSDLTQGIKTEYSGEFERITYNANESVKTLVEILAHLKEAANVLKKTTTEIRSDNNDLAHRTQQQATALEETSATMQEFTASVQHNSKQAKSAKKLAVSATEVAKKGGEVMRQVIERMQQIHESSRNIVDIIGVIDSIAFQTNILALNAAVEAARVGEQGKGFVVVAGEVRNLAQRSANAAKKIKALIDESVESVEIGTHLVHVAGERMDEILLSITEVKNIIADISNAYREQSLGIEYVNQSVIRIDDMTQQNVILVQKATVNTEKLAQQAIKLQEMFEQFKFVH